MRYTDKRFLKLVRAGGTYAAWPCEVRAARRLTRAGFIVCVRTEGGLFAQTPEHREDLKRLADSPIIHKRNASVFAW